VANPILRKSYIAGAIIAPGTAVKFSASGTVVPSVGADSMIGITVPQLTAQVGDRVDVVLIGIADAAAGGPVTRGDLLTADATGRMVTAVGFGTGEVRIIGKALESAVVGDIFPVLIG
jgi:hypothetical protein